MRHVRTGSTGKAVPPEVLDAPAEQHARHTAPWRRWRLAGSASAGPPRPRAGPPPRPAVPRR
jgi:hypothetical protein